MSESGPFADQTHCTYAYVSHVFSPCFTSCPDKEARGTECRGKEIGQSARRPSARDPRLRPSAPGESTTQLRRCGSLVPTESRMDGGETQLYKSGNMKGEKGHSFYVNRAKMLFVSQSPVPSTYKWNEECVNLYPPLMLSLSHLHLK